MGFDEFMDTLDNGVTKRFDQMMAEQDHEAGREKVDAARWQYAAMKFEEAQLNENRKNLGFGSW